MLIDCYRFADNTHSPAIVLVVAPSTFRVASARHAARPLREMLFCGLLNRCRIIEQNPLDYGDWQAAILDQVIMKLTEPKIFALPIFVTTKQIHDLPFAGDVADFLRGT